MGNFTKNKIRRVYYRALDFNDNVTDFDLIILKPNGVQFNPSPTIHNIGDGIYKFSYIPRRKGVWIEKIKF